MCSKNIKVSEEALKEALASFAIDGMFPSVSKDNVVAKSVKQPSLKLIKGSDKNDSRRTRL